MKNSVRKFSDFRNSWQGDVLVIVVLALLSSFLITFYTTNLSLLQSLKLMRHLHTWLAAFLLMLPVVIAIAYAVYRFDQSRYFQRHELLRWMLQFVLLVVLLSVVCLQVVYWVYERLFAIDLHHTDYFERDFVVVMSCIGYIQVYFKIRADYRRWYELQKVYAALERNFDKSMQSTVAVRKLLIEAKNENKTLKEENAVMRTELAKLSQLIKESMRTIRVQFELSDAEIPISQVVSVFLDKAMAEAKIVQARLLDGRVGMLDFNSLARVKSHYPVFLFAVNRNKLICRFAIKSIVKEADKCFLLLYGNKETKVNISQQLYAELLENEEAWQSLLEDRADLSTQDPLDTAV